MAESSGCIFRVSNFEFMYSCFCVVVHRFMPLRILCRQFSTMGLFNCSCVFACTFSPFLFSVIVEELENKLMRQKCEPPYLFRVIWIIAIAYMADKTKLRMPYMVLSSVITLVGLLLTAYVK